MSKSPEEIKTAYETLKARHKSGAGLTRFRSAVAPVLLGLANGAADGGIPQKLQDYLNALTAVFLLSPDELSRNQVKLMAALAQLDGFGGFMDGRIEGIQTFRWLLDHSAKHGVTEEKVKDVVKKVNEATGLQIVLPPLAPAANREPVQSAAQWIRDWKDDLPEEQGKPDYPDGYFAKIMAARMLAGSNPGDKDKLDSTQLTASAVSAKARELLENRQFRGFLDSLKGEQLHRAESAVASRGHCGGLDDMFRDYLKNLGAGKLTNEALLDRYMPTVQERIEILQKQTEKNAENGQVSCAAEAAEITVLRNMVRAERNEKTRLQKKIPTTEQSSLEKQTFLLRNSELYLKRVGMAGTGEFRDLVRKGHGGEMVEKLRLEEKNMPQSEQVRKLLYENTLGGRLETIKKDAEKLREKLGSAVDKHGGDSPEAEAAVKQAKGLLAEYLALDMLCRNPVTMQLDPELMKQGIPWSKLDAVRNNPDKNPVVKQLTADIGPISAMKGLKDMAELSHKDFLETVQTQYRAPRPNRAPQAEGGGVDVQSGGPRQGIHS